MVTRVDTVFELDTSGPTLHCAKLSASGGRTRGERDCTVRPNWRKSCSDAAHGWSQRTSKLGSSTHGAWSGMNAWNLLSARS